MIPIWQRLERLSNDSTYAELALRAYEFVQYSGYRQEGLHPQHEVYTLAQTTWFNCLSQFLMDLGMAEDEASTFCDDDDNLLELALRIQSTTGYGMNLS